MQCIEIERQDCKKLESGPIPPGRYAGRQKDYSTSHLEGSARLGSIHLHKIHLSHLHTEVDDIIIPMNTQSFIQ